jgi:hypothetical protein
MNIGEKMEGGCLCGAVRYSVSGAPFAAEYCHCRMCQKSAGAVVVNWMDYRVEQMTWTNGKPVEYESSKSVRRGFCANCGSTIMENKMSQYIITYLGGSQPSIPGTSRDDNVFNLSA